MKLAKQAESMPKTALPKKRQPSGRISAACEACKKRKTKCTGGPPPCQLCQSLGTECVIDLSLDMRRRAALQRTIDESKGYQESLSGLLDCLRDGNPEMLQTITDTLRGGAPPQDLSTVIHNLSSRVREADGEQGSDQSLMSSSVPGTRGETFFDRAGFVTDAGNYDFDRVDNIEDHDASFDTRGRQPGRSRLHTSLFQYLMYQDSAEADRALQELVPAQNALAFARTHDLLAIFEPSESDFAPSRPAWIQADGLRNQDRSEWHPALQSRFDVYPGLTSLTSHATSDASMNQKTPVQVSGPWMSQDDPATTEPGLESRDHQHAHGIRPGQRPPDVTSSRSETSRTPYRELNTLPLDADSTDLCVAQEEPEYRWRIPIHLVQSITIPDDSALGQVYDRYLRAARKMMSSGVKLSQLLGPDDRVIVDLLFRQRMQEDRWDCCGWACELVRSFTEYEIFVRLACAFFLSRLMKWVLVPTPENYHRVPDMIKPTPMQRQVPHIAPIDLVPLPCIRDATIVRLRDWLTPLAKGRWTVNWPFTEQDAMERDPVTMSISLTRRFMNHVETPQNWSVGTEFLNAFPELAGKVRLH